MYRLDIQSNQSISHIEQLSFESVCTYRICDDQRLERDCEKYGRKCYKNEDHSIVIDGIEGIYLTDTEKKTYA